MCGIFGVINIDGNRSTDVRLRDYFTDALFAGSVRGKDGAGMFQVDEPSNEKHLVYFQKTSSDGGSLATDTRQQVVNLRNDTGRAFLNVGHNRAATHGKVSEANAHPFVIDREDNSIFIGVHNGSLDHDWNEQAGAKDFEVDSNFALDVLSKKGPKGIEELAGAMAFVWYDSRLPSNAFMYTDGNRPLHFGVVAHSQGKKILIASEAEMLYWLAKRNKLSLENDEVLVCKANTLYTFDANDKDLRKYKSEVITPERFFPFRSTRQISRPSTSGAGTYKGYAEEAKDEVKRIVDEAIKEAKAKSGAAPAAATSTPLSLAPTPATTPPTIVRRLPNSTPEEHKMLTELGIKPGTEVTFEGEKFEFKYWQQGVDGSNVGTSMGDLVGTVVFETAIGVEDIGYAVVRNISRQDAESWINVPASCRAIGACIEVRKTTNSSELIYVMSKPVIALGKVN